MKNYVTTFSGETVFPLHPDPALIRIVDIAHQLAMDCRFTGAVRRFYSTAQHSVLGSLVIEKLYPEFKDVAMDFLLHDAEEAYMRDMPKGIKDLPELNGYCEIAKNLRRCILVKHGRPPELHPIVKEVDCRLGATEAKSLLSKIPAWVGTEGFEPYGFEIFPVNPETAEQMFLTRFLDLGGDINL